MLQEREVKHSLICDGQKGRNFLKIRAQSYQPYQQEGAYHEKTNLHHHKNGSRRTDDLKMNQTKLVLSS